MTAGAHGWSPYELESITGWVSVPEETARDQDRGTYLAGRVAVLVPDGEGPTEEQGVVAMVGVLNAQGTDHECSSVFDTWPANPLLHGTAAQSSEVSLPAGPATQVKAKLESDNSETYLYFMRRFRRVGLAHEDLCYALVVVGKPGVALD